MSIEDITTFAQMYSDGIVSGAFLSGIVFVVGLLISSFIGWIDRV